MKRTRTIVTLLLLALLLPMLPLAAARAEVTISKAGEFPIASEPITLTVWIEGGSDLDWTNNGYLAYIEELTNVRLEIIPSSTADARDKRNMLFASGDYPDMLLTDWGTMFTHADIYQFGIKEGMLIPINDYIDEYSVELKEIYERFPEYRQQTTAPDGNIYGVARFSQCYHCMAYPKFFMNMEWLEALGLDAPTNTDELREVLIAIRDGDPNGNGIADEIPLTGATEWTCPVEWAILGMAYLPVRPDFWMYLENGEVKFAPEQDAYREGLRYIKSLYDEGLIDPAAFSQKFEQMRTLIRQEPYAVGAFPADNIGMGPHRANNPELYAAFDSLREPIAGPSGFKHQPSNSGEAEVTGFHGVITDKCQYPEAAFRVMDLFLTEEEGVRKGMGKEGIGWVYAEPGTQSVLGGEVKYIQLAIGEDEPEKLAEQEAYQFWPGPSADLAERRAAGIPMPEDILDPNAFEARITLQTEPLLPYLYPEKLPASLFIPLEDFDEYTEIQTNLNDFIRKTAVQFIIGQRDIETGWEAYLEELARYGADRYLAIYTSTYETSIGE